jgi:hypothetical protein
VVLRGVRGAGAGVVCVGQSLPTLKGGRRRGSAKALVENVPRGRLPACYFLHALTTSQAVGPRSAWLQVASVWLFRTSR